MKRFIFAFVCLFLSSTLLIAQNQTTSYDLLDFGAVWCIPCKRMEPIIDSIAKDYKVLKIDVDKSPELTQQYGVTKFPTIIVMKNGVAFEIFVGVTSEITLRNSLNRAKAVEMTSESNSKFLRKLINIIPIFKY